MQEYNDVPEDEVEEQEDMIDAVPELGADELEEENGRQMEKEAKKITTKFLTKYERGMLPKDPLFLMP